MTEVKQYPQQSAVEQSMNESLSALMDSEASEMELHRVLKATEDDPQLRQKWSRYQLASSAIKGDLPSAPLFDISAAVREAIDEEPVFSGGEERVDSSRRGWGSVVSRFAGAASVAAVVVVTAQFTGLQSAGDNVVVADAESPSQELRPSVALPSGFEVPSLSARTVSSHPRMANEVGKVSKSVPQVVMPVRNVTSQPPSEEVQSYLYKVMEQHAANAALHTNRGMLPYARVPAEPSAEQQ
jgi:sigma-E factor negative regulatory protein RseA